MSLTFRFNTATTLVKVSIDIVHQQADIISTVFDKLLTFTQQCLEISAIWQITEIKVQTGSNACYHCDRMLFGIGTEICKLLKPCIIVGLAPTIPMFYIFLRGIQITTQIIPGQYINNSLSFLPIKQASVIAFHITTVSVRHLANLTGLSKCFRDNRINTITGKVRSVVMMKKLV